MKLCIDCKHYKETKKTLPRSSIVDVSKMCTYFKKIDPVNGTVIVEEMHCTTARSTSSLCGRRADYFSRVKRENTSPWWRSWFK